MNKKGEKNLTLFVALNFEMDLLGEERTCLIEKGFAKMLALISVPMVNALRLNEALTVINVPRCAFLCGEKEFTKSLSD